VIYIATVHWVDPKWIVPQRRALDAEIQQPFRVFANLEGIETRYDEYFDWTTRSGGPHPQKLNELASVISEVADPADLIVFLDGDAFPVRNLDTWLPALLADAALAAVRRDENAGDIQPHPCFCVTTVGLWNEIGGDWRNGSWVTAEGNTASDVGGTLLAILATHSVDWRPILRSNGVNLHPVFYGLYEGHIYHHGSGFRPPIARADEGNVPVSENEEYLYWKTRAHGRSIREIRPRHAKRLARLALDSARSRRLNAYIRRETRRSDEIYDQICSDPGFFRRFESEDSDSLAAS
jgi:hypothetical protein